MPPAPAQAGDAEAPEDWKVHARQWECRGLGRQEVRRVFDGSD